ncbi:hypothetical protein ACB092_05G044600 [Castanea dentata]
MVKFNNIFIMVVILASGVMASLAQKKISPPRHVPGYPLHLLHCARRVEDECGREIFLGMFQKLSVSKKCCLQLIKKMGKTCHDDLDKAVVHLPEYSSRSSMAIPKGNRIWHKCALSHIGYLLGRSGLY